MHRPEGMRDRASALGARLKRLPPKDALVTLEAAQIEDVATTPQTTKALFDTKARVKRTAKAGYEYVQTGKFKQDRNPAYNSAKTKLSNLRKRSTEEQDEMNP